MIGLVSALLLVTGVIAVSDAQQKTSHLPYVNPFIGTTKSAVLTSWGGNGGTYPGAVAPSGAVQLSPETRVTGAKGYDYSDQAIYYFSCLKHYSGFPEGSAGHLMLMPVVSGANFEAGKSRRVFSHRDETAQPGYYKVIFKDNHTIAEASASVRTGRFRFTFAAKVKPELFIGDAGEITLRNKRLIYGENSHTVLSLSEDFTSGKPVKGGYLFTFRPSAVKAKTIEIQLSTSTVDFEGAANNIKQESAQSFEQFRNSVSKEWDKALSTIDLTDPNEGNKTVFYTAVYHSLLIPWVISDADGRYRAADGQVHQHPGSAEYGGFSPWDTFRSLHPLLSLLYPAKQNDIILSMLHFYQQSGHLPTETMTGNHAVPIITDAYLKGITGYDKSLAYEAMKKNIVEAPFVQSDMEIYHQLDYVPFSNSESVTRTVEYAYDDWALAQYAQQVMKNDHDYHLLIKRGFNYRNLFYPEDLFMLPRKGNVFKREPGMSGYKEGNKWIYTYFVPHNAKDLVNLLGGNTDFSNRLDSALRHQVILYDNETVLHLPYLFGSAGHPELMQKWLGEIMNKRFSNSPGGLPGNDDLGSMSSAYIFNALGIFPVSPGRPVYMIGSPLFQSVKLHLAKGKTFVINSRNQASAHPYVQSLTLNGMPYQQLTIDHAVLMNGGRMDYTMSAQPQSWPVDKDPVVLSETKKSSSIELLQYAVAKVKVEPDELFWIRFSLSNNGSIGTKKIKVYVNGAEYGSKNYLVPEGKTVKDSISCRLYRLGKTRIGLAAEDKGMVEVISPAHPIMHPYLVSALKLKSVVQLNDQQEVSYTVKNLTGTDQAFTVPVMADGAVLYQDSVDLSPGEGKMVHHAFKVTLTGLHKLSADTVTVSYKVYNSAVSSLLLDLSLSQNGTDKVVKDHSGFNNNGLVIGAGSAAPEGRLLLGDSCYVEVPASANLDKLEESITMMAWVYPEGKETGLVDLLTKGDSHVLQTTDHKTLTFFAGGWGRGDVTVKVPENWKQQWHHIAGVCKGDSLSLYIDGKLFGAAKVDGVVNLSVGNTWQIGRNEEFPAERIFHGSMDGVKVYEQALSSAEVSKVFREEQEKYH